MATENQKESAVSDDRPASEDLTAPDDQAAPDALAAPDARPADRIGRLAVAAALAVLLVAADQWTKVVAERELAGRGARRLAGEFAILVFTWNSGAFLSLGSGLSPVPRRILLLLVPALILAVLGYILVKRARARGITATELAAAALLVAGGVGNLIDRAVFGAVRDFLNFGIGPLRTGIMNLADLYILGALVILIVSTAREDRRRRLAERKAAE